MKILKLPGKNAIESKLTAVTVTKKNIPVRDMLWHKSFSVDRHLASIMFRYS